MAKAQIATFLGPQLGLSITGNHCYAYSGLMEIDNNETTMLEFTTGNYYSVMKVQFNYPDTDTSEDYQYKTYLAGIVIQSFVVDYGKITYPKEYDIIVPPYTPVKCTAANIAATNTRTQIVGITGRIYDA